VTLSQADVARAKRTGKTVWGAGLGFKPTRDGRGSWVAQYVVKSTGKDRRVTLGRGDVLTLKQAREMAREVLVEVTRGGDPKAEREKAATAEHHTLKNVAAIYLSLEGQDLRSLKKRKRDLNRWIAEFGNRPMADIRRGDVVSFLDKLEASNGANAAESALVAFRRLANWYALRNEDYTSPVVRGMGRVDQMAQRRTRTLSDKELVALWRCTGTTHPYHALCRFLLLTGTRLEEACGMRRTEVAPNGDWTIPAERMKKTKVGPLPHLVPLSHLAQDVLRSVPMVGLSPYVFTITGRSSISGYTKFKEALDAKMVLELGHGFDRWTHHDLRRTARSLLSRGLVPADIAERCLAHSMGAIRGTYDLHAYYHEKKQAFLALAQMVLTIVDPTAASNVVALARGAIHERILVRHI
jgi:integrase